MSYAFLTRTASRRDSAFTLIELLVAFSLTVLLVGLMYQFLIPALKISNRITHRAESQQQATLALRNMVSELEESNLFGISFSSSANVVAVHPVEEVTQNSQRIYANHVVVYQFSPESEKITRSEWRNGDDPSPAVARKLTEAELQSLQPHLSKSRLMVSNVSEFEVKHSGTGDLVKLPLILRLKMREQAQSGDRSFELIRTISLRNQI